MRVRSRYYFFGICLLFLYLYFKVLYLNNVQNEENPIHNNRYLPPVQSNMPWFGIQKNVTLLVRYVPDLPDHLNETINSFLNVYPILSVVIVSDSTIAQPLLLNKSAQVKVIPLKLNLLELIVDRNPLNYVKTKYLLIVPLGVDVIPPQDILKLIERIEHTENAFLALPVSTVVQLGCLKLQLNLREWTVEYTQDKATSICDAVTGEHGIFLKTANLRKIAEPFMLPFPEPLYIQAKSLNMNAEILNSFILKRKPLDNTNDVHHNIIEQKIFMNQLLGVKKVVRESGVTEWYGCTRKTRRCFPTILDSTPDYLHEGRWTPPCCLRVLRETAHHVLKMLQQWNVTYWLEGGTLLGAMRNKDIIPWDYDVDIGILLEDINKCPWLRKVYSQKLKGIREPTPIVDTEGFVWSAAERDEGDFYRVKASMINTLHVDIFPFYSREGIMTKDTWLSSHPQDKEFPDHFLKPLTTIEFAGFEASAPNNIREFLEFKFGKGCVENPQYPNPKILTFPKEREHVRQEDNENYDINNEIS